MGSSRPVHDGKIKIVFILLLSIQAQAALDMYLPGLPNIADNLHTTQKVIQLSLIFFLAPMGMIQPLIGFISRYINKRRLLGIALSVFCLGSLLCATAYSLPLFFLGRTLQGIAAGITSNQFKVLLTDFFCGDLLGKISSYCVSAWGLAIVISPIIGSMIIHIFNWRTCFLLLFFIEIIPLAILVFIPETNGDKKQFSINTFLKHIRDDSKEVLTNFNFLSFTFICGLYFFSINIFNIESPFIIISRMHYSHITYGKIMSIIALGYFFGSLTNARLISVFSPKWIIASAALSSIVFFILMKYHGNKDIISLVTLFTVYAFIGGIIMSNCLSGAISNFDKSTPIASAYYGLVVYLLGGAANLFTLTNSEPSTVGSLFIPVILINVAIFAICLFPHKESRI